MVIHFMAMFLVRDLTVLAEVIENGSAVVKLFINSFLDVF